MKRLIVFACFAIGCGDNTVPPGGGGDMSTPDLSTAIDMTLTGDQACADFGMQICARIQACEPTILQFVFGDPATCNTRLALECAQGLKAQGLTNPAQLAEQCAQAYAALSCNDLVLGSNPPACTAAGMRMNGLACGGGSQCMSSYCAQPKGGGCGTCGPAPTAGASCANLNDCGNGLLCAGDNTCEPAVAAAGKCDNSHPCGKQLTCVGSGMPRIGTCQPVLEAGATCDTTTMTTAQCDSLSLLFCKPAGMTTMGTCTMAMLAKPGDMCGFVNGTIAICQGGGHCVLVNQNPPMGTCIAPAADGSMCDPQKGPDCLAPAVCYQNVCRIPDPTVCG